MKKSQRAKAQAIQKEQHSLVQVENILTILLGQINESINELKVEELHLKSSLIEHTTGNLNEEQPSTSAQAALRLNATPLIKDLSIKQPNGSIDMEGIENINKQLLAVESLLVPLKQKNFNNQEEEEEEDDDDSKDDDYAPTEHSESDNEECKD